MMQCVRRCSFICGAVLSILLLLCSCQAGAGPLILPDNVPSKNTSQGKEKLLAALNTVDIRRPETTQDSYIQGADSVAETIFLCIQKESGNNAAAAIELLSESRDTGLSNCADVVLNRLSPSPDETIFGELCASQRRCSGRWCFAGRCRPQWCRPHPPHQSDSSCLL